MLNLKKVENWYILEDKVFVWNWINKDYINLFLTRWEDIIMWCDITKKIDYPGEYDIDSIYFKVFDIDWKLNYIITNLNGKNVAFVQSSQILEKEEFDNIDFWLFSDSLIEEFINKLEYEGEKIKLEL